MDLEEIGISAGNWVNSAQEKDYCKVLVSVALKLGFHIPWSWLI